MKSPSRKSSSSLISQPVKKENCELGPRLNLAPKSEHRSAHQGHDDKLGGEPDGGPDGFLEDLLDDVNVELAAHVHRVDDHHQHQY